KNELGNKPQKAASKHGKDQSNKSNGEGQINSRSSHRDYHILLHMITGSRSGIVAVVCLGGGSNVHCSRSAEDDPSSRKNHHEECQQESLHPETEVGHITASYRDVLVSHLVDDESCRRGNEASYHNLKAAYSSKETHTVPVGDRHLTH